jgi:Arc/MetJ family transcription regulator
LDDKLVEQAVELGKFKTKREAINSALVEYVAHRLRILELAGQIDFDSDWDY